MYLYFNVENANQNLLYKLYLFNFILTENSQWNPNPYVGDVQLKALMSYMTNLIHWNKCTNFYGKMETTPKLVVREECLLTGIIREDIQRLRTKPEDVVTIQHNHRYAVTEYRELVRNDSFKAFIIA